LKESAKRAIFDIINNIDFEIFSKLYSESTK